MARNLFGENNEAELLPLLFRLLGESKQTMSPFLDDCFKKEMVIWGFLLALSQIVARRILLFPTRAIKHP